jgi:cytochrome P450
MAEIHRFSAEILADRKAAVLAESSGDVKKDAFPANDLLSLLIKSNIASDVPERMRMSDEELQGREYFNL